VWRKREGRKGRRKMRKEREIPLKRVENAWRKRRNGKKRRRCGGRKV